MNVKRKTPTVNLRERKLPSGKIQLFLDITVDGKRTRESLNMFLDPAKTRVAREKNRETIAIATEIADKRRLDEIARANGMEVNDGGQYTLFFDYFEKCANKHNGNSLQNWLSTLFHMKIYAKNNDITLIRVNRDWLEGFRTYLTRDALHYHHCIHTGQNLPTRAKNDPSKFRHITDWTASIHFSRVVTALNWAVKDGLIQNNPSARVDSIKFDQENERQYLTKEELKRLLETPMPAPKIVRKEEYIDMSKRAIIFSLMTGMRMSDVKQVRWNMISVNSEGRYRITFKQKKTRGMMYLDISKLASEQLGERFESDEPIFKINDMSLNNYLKRWVDAAGIKKHITFHCCRHTFATLALQAGADLYTTSKLLGHSNVRTTQIYAKIVDEKKQQAVDMLDEFIK